MSEKSIETLTIKGFKSIKKLNDFPLRNLNILIGPNGSGKSNFISFFSMMKELVNGRLQLWTAKQGNADRVVSYGADETDFIESEVKFTSASYKFRLEATESPRVLCHVGPTLSWLLFSKYYRVLYFLFVLFIIKIIKLFLSSAAGQRFAALQTLLRFFHDVFYLLFKNGFGRQLRPILSDGYTGHVHL